MTYSRENGPRYREAYPRVDILKAAANARKGRDLCVFGVGPDGILDVLRFTPNAGWTEAILTGSLGGPHIDFWKGSTAVELVPSSGKFGTGARAAICPACRRRVQILVFTHRWGCPSCARLFYRRQLVDRTILRVEELQALRSRPKQRPKGMHQRTFRRRERRAMERIVLLTDGLKKKQTFNVASGHHSYTVEAHWLSEQEFRTDSRLGGFLLPDRPPSE